MSSPRESRAALQLLTVAAVDTSLQLLSRVSGTPDARRYALLEAVPEVIGYYAEGSAALAADFYEEQRELAGGSRPFVAELVVADRVVKIRRGIAWASDPLFDADDLTSGKRLAEVVQLESARPYRDTITTNRANDPASAGWRRITNGGCRLCRMLADRGAVYKEDTARFATHPNCNCSAAPVFVGAEGGPEASVIQYTASRRNRTPQQQATLRDYLDTYY